VYVAMLLAQTLLKLEDGASNMATRSRLAAWMNALIRALRMDFLKDMEPTIVAMSSIVQRAYSARICFDFLFFANKSSTVTNKSITVSTTTNFITKSGTVTTNSFTVTTESSTVMKIDILIQQVMQFVGMGNWEQVHTFAAVCKFLRHSSLPHLSNIGKVPMDGGAERRLNDGVFLRFLR
jgi:hypothetical protein